MSFLLSSPAGGLTAGLKVRATATVFAAAVILPIVIHFVPSADGVPWGARLLPMFYAPFLGIAFFPLHVGLIPAFLAPVTNGLITGLPNDNLVIVLTAELTVFTVLAWTLLRRRPSFWAAAPLSYIAAKLVSTLLISILPFLNMGMDSTEFFLASVFNAIPGLLLLLIINIGIYRSREKPVLVT